MQSAKGLSHWDRNGYGDDVSFSNPPDPYQGFGRVTLETALPLSTSTSGNNLFVLDHLTIASYEVIRMQVDLQAGSDLVATLAWYDPPNWSGAGKQLLHDLDLEVYSLADPTNSRVFPNNLAWPDQDNNIEKINLQNAQLNTPGTYVIQVSAGVLTEASSQSFALVANLNGILRNVTSSAPAAASLHKETSSFELDMDGWTTPASGFAFMRESDGTASSNTGPSTAADE